MSGIGRLRSGCLVLNSSRDQQVWVSRVFFRGSQLAGPAPPRPRDAALRLASHVAAVGWAVRAELICVVTRGSRQGQCGRTVCDGMRLNSVFSWVLAPVARIIASGFLG